jgi:hypothetical protein
VVLAFSQYIDKASANITYGLITLTTNQWIEGTFTLSAYVNGFQALCESDCNFTYASASSPTIVSATPGTFSDLNITLL